MENTALKIPDKNAPKIFDRISLVNCSMPRVIFDSRVEKARKGQLPKFDSEAKHYLDMARKVEEYELLFSSAVEREKRYLSMADDYLQNLEYSVLLDNLSDRLGMAFGRLEACIGRETMLNENNPLIFMPFEKPSNQSLQDICLAHFDSALERSLTELGRQKHETDISELRHKIYKIVLDDTYRKMVNLASHVMAFEFCVDAIVKEAARLENTTPALPESNSSLMALSSITLASRYEDIYCGVFSCFDYSGVILAISDLKLTGDEKDFKKFKKFITATEDADRIAEKFTDSLFPDFPEPEIKKENNTYAFKLSGLETEKIKSINAFLVLARGKERMKIDLSDKGSEFVSVRRPFGGNGTEYSCEFAITGSFDFNKGFDKSLIVEMMPSYLKFAKSQEYRI